MENIFIIFLEIFMICFLFFAHNTPPDGWIVYMLIITDRVGTDNKGIIIFL